MEKTIIFLVISTFTLMLPGVPLAQMAQSQAPVGRFQLVSVSAGQQAGVFLLDTANGCTWQLGRNQETNRLTFVEMDVENLHWSWGSGAQQRLAQKIDESRLPNDQRAAVKQELTKTACGLTPVVLTPPTLTPSKPEAAPTKKK